MSRGGLVLAALVIATGCKGRDQYVVAPTPLRFAPTTNTILHDESQPGNARENMVGFLELGDVVEVLEREEEWTRVQDAKGVEGWVLPVYLVPVSGTTVAVALEPGDCYPGRFSSPLPDKAIEPGRILFLGRSFLGWRAYASPEAPCVWAKAGFYSAEPEDVEVGKLVAHAKAAPKRAEMNKILDRARSGYPGAAAQSLVASLVAERTPKEPPRWDPPPPGAPGEVPPSKAPPYDAADGPFLPVPDEYPGPPGDAGPLEIRPASVGVSFALVSPRRPVDWKPLARQYLPSLDIDSPSTEYDPRLRRGVEPFRAPAPAAEQEGRWYLATRAGVYAVKAVGLQGFADVPEGRRGAAVQLGGSLLLGPAPRGGAGFAIWAAATRTFRARPLRTPALGYSQDNLVLDLSDDVERDGRLVLVRHGEAPARVTIDRPHAPLHAAYRLEVLPGGDYLLVSLEEKPGPGRGEVQGWECRPALLLRASDLSEVARSECEH